ncbi:hypothetical protein [uncultured Paraglaciecola sp.]|uniref:hypothetical protein n=1 Tax=uncultured Paraglaciecola sp. TaxID=1765024 RepID=UPI0025987ED9|nr:hypothetical protein [uncultured Paraglaciecola sp.]
MTEEELEKLRDGISRTLEGRDYPSVKDKMLTVSSYYRYMSTSIASDEILIDCDRELLSNFEAVYLWLIEQLVYLPAHLKNQVENIFQEAKLCELFAILSSLSDKEIWTINRRRRLSSSMGIFASFFKIRNYSELEESQLVSTTHLVNAKIALTRLSQVTRFSASKFDDDFYAVDGFEEFSSRYNPEIINKARIVALVNLLKSQFHEIEENDDTKLILEKLEAVEKEINKRKPHWGLIFSTVFVIFGFTADLKTLNPDAYKKPLETIEAILYNLHEDGQVEKNISKKLPYSPNDNGKNQKSIGLFRREDIEPESEE